MKKIFLILLCGAFLLTSCGSGGNRSQSIMYEKDTPHNRIAQYIEDLAAEDMAGRRAGTEGEIKASLFLANFFQQAGLQPAGDLNTYFQTFSIGRYEPREVKKRMVFQLRPGEGGQAENILGILPGKEPGYIVICAHYDHLGIINDQLYPGANDNASGVAIVMELINQLVERKPTYSILFALWSAEEMGLLGSKYFCSNPTVPLQEIKAVVNFDSIGNISDNKELLAWQAKENETSKRIIDILEKDGWTIKWEEANANTSDQASFNNKGVAGFTLLSPKWLNRNHTIKDEARRIEIEPLVDLVETFKKALLTIGR